MVVYSIRILVTEDWLPLIWYTAHKETNTDGSLCDGYVGVEMYGFHNN